MEGDVSRELSWTSCGGTGWGGDPSFQASQLTPASNPRPHTLSRRLRNIGALLDFVSSELDSTEYRPLQATKSRQGAGLMSRKAGRCTDDDGPVEPWHNVHTQAECLAGHGFPCITQEPLLHPAHL